MKFQLNDGGRAEAGFKGIAGDCVTRAIAIATGQPYRQVYDLVAKAVKQHTGVKSARNGVPKGVTRQVMGSLGWHWKATMAIGKGCQVHLDADELPSGTIIVKLSRHIACVIDGVVHDTYDCTRDGSRCVYGYWFKPC